MSFLLLFILLTQASPSSAPDEGDVFAILEEEREMVEVSTRKLVSARVAPAIVDVLTDVDMHRLGLRTIADVLELTTSVLLVRGPNGDLYPVVRGFGTKNGVSVLMDGVPLLDTMTGQFAHYEMSIQGLKRVEVLRGPGSALYGGNAQVAVINLVTHDDASAKDTELQLMVGTGIDVRGHALHKVRLGAAGTLSLFAAAQHETTPLLPTSADGVSARGDLAFPSQSLADPSNPLTSPSRRTPSQRLVAQASWQLPFGLYLRERTLLRQIEPMYGPGVGGGDGSSALPPTGGYQRTDFLLLSEIGFKRELKEWLALNASLRHVMNHRAQGGKLTGPLSLNKDRNGDLAADVFPSGMEERYAYRDHVVALDTQLTFKLPLNELMVGANGSLQLIEGLHYQSNFEPAAAQSTSPGLAPTLAGDLQTTTGRLFALPGSRRSSLAVFAQDVFSPWSFIDLIAGARLDVINDLGIISDAQVRADELCAMSPFGDCVPRGFAALRKNGKGYFQVTPRAGIVLKAPVGGLVGKFLYGHAFTPPPAIALINQTPSENRAGQTFANPLLKPVLSKTFEAQVSAEPIKQQVLRVGYFHVSTSDEVVYDALNQAYLNNAQRAVNGVEAEAHGTIEAHRLLNIYYRAGISWSSTIAVGGQLLGIGSDTYPAVVGYGSLSFAIAGHVELTSTVNGQSASRREAGDPRSPIPARAIWSAQARVYDFGVAGLEAGVIARNILDTPQRAPTTQYQQLSGDVVYGARSVLFFVQWGIP